MSIQSLLLVARCDFLNILLAWTEDNIGGSCLRTLYTRNSPISMIKSFGAIHAHANLSLPGLERFLVMRQYRTSDDTSSVESSSMWINKSWPAGPVVYPNSCCVCFPYI